MKKYLTLLLSVMNLLAVTVLSLVLIIGISGFANAQFLFNSFFGGTVPPSITAVTKFTSSTQFAANTPNAVVGNVTVTMSVGNFTGSLSVTGVNSCGFYSSAGSGNNIVIKANASSGCSATGGPHNNGVYDDWSVVATQSGITYIQAESATATSAAASLITNQILAVNYEQGGLGVGYNWSNPFNGSTCNNTIITTYRSDYADIKTSADPGFSYQLGCNWQGVWYNYSVTVANAGTYVLNIGADNGAASGTAGTWDVLIDGAQVSTINVPGDGSGCYTCGYLTATSPTFNLAAGTHILQLYSATGVATTYDNSGQPWPITNQVLAVNYNTGGDGLSYNWPNGGTCYDTQVTTYRADYADIKTSNDSGFSYQLGCSFNGTWYNYSVSVATSGTYTISIGADNGSSSSGTWNVLIDGTQVATITVPGDGSGCWACTYTTRTSTSFTLATGNHVLQLYSVNAPGDFVWWQGQVAQQQCSTSQPAPAAAAGYNVMTLGPCVNYNPNGGGDWCAYLGAQCGHGTIYYTNNSDGSFTLSGGTQNGGGGQLATRKVFGKGLYAEATYTWTGAYVQGGPSPAWWAYGSDGTMLSDGDWNTDTSVCSLGCASASIEADIDEEITGVSGTYLATMHHWGPSACCNSQDQQTFNGDQTKHRRGMLWVPATSTTKGYVQWYLDGSAVGYPYTWSYGETGDTGDIDSEYLIFFLNSDNDHTITVYNVQIWQASSSDALCCDTKSP